VDRTDINGRLEQRPPRTVAAMSAWLHQRREWLAEQDWVADLWGPRSLKVLHSQLRGAWGDPAMSPLGPCIKLVDDAGRLCDDGPWSCGWQLFMPEQPPKAMDEPVRLPSIRCPACDWTYHGSDLVQLGRLRWEARQIGREQAHREEAS